MPLHRLLCIVLLSLFASLCAAQPNDIIFTAPLSGELWLRELPHEITWRGDFPGDLSLQLYRDGDFDRLIAAPVPGSGQYLWHIPDDVPPGSLYQITLVSVEMDTIVAWSPPYFTIALTSWVTVVVPNGGESWQLGSVHQVNWTDNVAGNLRIELLRHDNVAAVLADSAGNTGSFTWHIPDNLPEDTAYRIRITSLLHPTAIDTSDSVFALMAPPSLRVVVPNGREIWVVGEVDTVRWACHNVTSPTVRIELKRNFPGSSWITLASAADNTGAFPWTVTGPETNSARIRIRAVLESAAVDTSDQDFSITQSLTFLEPPRLTIYGNADNCRLYWSKVGGARYYEVWGSATMDDEDFVQFGTTADTTLQIAINSWHSHFFRVIAVH